MTFSSENPFTGRVPDTVPLPQTPLTGVLVQIKFPQILSIAKTDHVAAFQEEIRGLYPLNQQDQNIVLQLGPDGPKPTQSPNWRFFDVDSQWRISLTTNFLAIETRAYDSRTDLTDRVATVALALERTINPGIMTRIGVRYIDRIYGDPIEALDQYVRPEVLGLFTAAHSQHLVRTIGEINGRTNVGPMTSRWGYMPANETHEPDLMPAIGKPSWFLDVDVYQEYKRPLPFDSSDIGSHVMDLATRSYGFFRWVVNDDFLKLYGGEL